MRIGFVGLGKLGAPVAECFQDMGHTVLGYDICRSDANVHKAGSLDELNGSDVIFVAVQTPHDPEYEGITRIPDERSDFDYSYLKNAVKSLSEVITRDTIVAVISTVLPGTMEREIIPLGNSHMRFVYNPSFIAMGSVKRDFMDPEFVLLGGDDGTVADLYRIDAPKIHMDIVSAELAKVAYNTFISAKIAIVNVLMEICQKTGADIDSVSTVLKAANRRITGPAYMDGGMGDGGGCHPRDNIAMSWLARRLNVHYDIFDAVMKSREKQAEWLADLLIGLSKAREQPISIVGYEYKPDTDMTVGSHSLLVRHILDEKGVEVHDIGPAVYLLGCRSKEHVRAFEPGSLVVDPFRYITEPPADVAVLKLGCSDGYS